MPRKKKRKPANHRPITRRELDVLGCLVDGQSDVEVAQNLGISKFTIKKHLLSLYPKLGVKNRVQAAVHAVRKMGM